MIFCRSEHFSSASPPSGADLAEKVVEVVVVVVLVAIFLPKNSQFLMVIAFSWADFGDVFLAIFSPKNRQFLMVIAFSWTDFGDVFLAIFHRKIVSSCGD